MTPYFPTSCQILSCKLEEDWYIILPMNVERGDSSMPNQLIVSGIKGDMGEPTRLELVKQADGDIIVSLRNTETGHCLQIEFSSFAGGSGNFESAQKLGELMELLATKEEQK